MALYEQTPEQLQNVINATGQTPVPQTINSSVLTPQPTVQYSTPKETPIYPVASLLAAPSPELTPTKSEGQANSLVSELSRLNESYTGQSAYRTDQETAQDITGKQNTVKDLTSRLTALKNEALAIPLQLQNEAKGRGITAAGLQPHQTDALRNNAIQALSVNSLLEAANGNLTTALSMVDRAVSQKFDPIKEQIDAKTKNLQLILNSPQYSLEQKNRAQRQLDFQNAQKAALEQAQQDQKDIYALAVKAASNGADAMTMQRIQTARSPQEALAVLATSGFANNPLDVEQQKAAIANTKANTAHTQADIGLTNAQTAKLYADIKKINADIEAGKPIDPNKLVPPGTPSEVKNETTLSTLLQNPKIGQSTRTNIANVLSVVAAVEDMAKNNQSGQFKGINPFNNILQPFAALKSKERIQNEGYINAINLQTQVWASGAALTKQQTEQVQKFTPATTDTDATIRTKLNNLANYMYTQTAAKLLSEGIQYTPEKVNLFETYDLLSRASPQQKAELKAQGLIQ